jgi:hypothetical protein
MTAEGEHAAGVPKDSGDSVSERLVRQLDEMTAALESLSQVLGQEEDLAVILHRLCRQAVHAIPGVMIEPSGSLIALRCDMVQVSSIPRGIYHPPKDGSGARTGITARSALPAIAGRRPGCLPMATMGYWKPLRDVAG